MAFQHLKGHTRKVERDLSQEQVVKDKGWIGLCVDLMLGRKSLL